MFRWLKYGMGVGGGAVCRGTAKGEAGGEEKHRAQTLPGLGSNLKDRASLRSCVWCLCLHLQAFPGTEHVVGIQPIFVQWVNA